MVKAVRETESAGGEINYELTKKQKSGKIFSRSLYVVKNSDKGETITEENLRSIRPGYGGHPKYLNKLIGKQFKNNFQRGDRFTNDDIKIHLE